MVWTQPLIKRIDVKATRRKCTTQIINAWPHASRSTATVRSILRMNRRRLAALARFTVVLNYPLVRRLSNWSIVSPFWETNRDFLVTIKTRIYIFIINKLITTCIMNLSYHLIQSNDFLYFRERKYRTVFPVSL